MATSESSDQSSLYLRQPLWPDYRCAIPPCNNPYQDFLQLHDHWSQLHSRDDPPDNVGIRIARCFNCRELCERDSTYTLSTCSACRVDLNAEFLHIFNQQHRDTTLTPTLRDQLEPAQRQQELEQYIERLRLQQVRQSEGSSQLFTTLSDRKSQDLQQHPYQHSILLPTAPSGDVAAGQIFPPIPVSSQVPLLQSLRCDASEQCRAMRQPFGRFQGLLAHWRSLHKQQQPDPLLYGVRLVNCHNCGSQCQRTSLQEVYTCDLCRHRPSKPPILRATTPRQHRAAVLASSLQSHQQLTSSSGLSTKGSS